MDERDKPRIVGRRTQVLSPWVTLVEAVVRTGAEDAVFHGFELSDYAVVCATTSSGRFPVVRQLRPIVGTETLEFPSGHVDPGEDPATSAAREFFEETGLKAKRLHKLSDHWVDTGRLTNRMHAYFSETDDPTDLASPEPELELMFLTQPELDAAIESGRFSHSLHVGVYALAKVRGFF